MRRSTFLSLAAVIALSVGMLAALAPDLFLMTKGIRGNPAASVWMRETGVALMTIGLMAWRMRRAPDSALLKTFMRANALLQLALLAIEFVAWRQGAIPEGMGILPNSVLHVLLALGFAVHAERVRLPASAALSSDSTTNSTTNLKESTR